MIRGVAVLSHVLPLPCACIKEIPKTGPIEGVLKLAYMALPQGGIVQIPLEKGFFAMEGLTVKAQPFEFGKLAVNSVIKGESDLAGKTIGVTIISKYSNTSGTSVRSVLDLLGSRVSLDQSLLLQLEDETRGALRLPAYAGRNMPDWLDYLYTDTLDSVAPEQGRVIK
jgi:hypothetical protein